MAGTLRPTGVGEEIKYKIWGELLDDPASNLFNQSYLTPARPYAFWGRAGRYLDIEFYSDVIIHDAGGSVDGYSNPLNIYSNENGVKGVYIGELASNRYSPSVPNWKIVAELPKGRYLIEFGRGSRISNEWYLERKSQEYSVVYNDGEYKTWIPPEEEGVELESSVPIMTSNNSPSGMVTASNQFTPAFQAFDRNPSTYWFASDASTIGKQFIQYRFDAPIEIVKMRVRSGVISGAYTGLKNFKLSGGNDGVNFTVLVEGVQPLNTEAIDYKLANTGEYLYYRLEGDSYRQVYEMLIIELGLFKRPKAGTPGYWESLGESIPSSSTIKEKGISDLTSIASVGDDSPIQQLIGEFELVTLSEDNSNDFELFLEIGATPKKNYEIVYPKSDINLTGIEGIDSIILTATGTSKVAISFDSGISYKAYRGGSWLNIQDASLGMTANELNVLASSEIESGRLKSETIRFSYFIADNDEVDKIEMKVSLSGTNQIANTSDYNMRYDLATHTIIYTIKRNMTVNVNYVDAE